MADLRITMTANTLQLERALARTRIQMAQFDGQLRTVGRSSRELDALVQQKHAQALRSFGRGLLIFGGAALAGLGMAAKAAIDWDSAWAGVLKTVEGSPQQLAKVEEGLRGLARELPVTHQEVARVAEVAGQLGVATDDIVGFTRVMIDLGQTTNLTSEQAALAISRLMNIMGTAPGEVENLGASLVDLGNNAATTESEILEMALRIAGAGATIGLSEADVLGFAAALSEVGIRAQAGGTSISRVMVNIADAVAGGGESLEGFAEVAGMSAEEFGRAFEEDPARAIQAFVEGLGRVDEAGGNVFTTLDELGLSEVRVRDAMLRLANAQGRLGDNLDRASVSWEENQALVKEAERRYDTAEAKIAAAGSSLTDMAIDIGEFLLPAVAGAAEGAGTLFDAIGDLPAPVQGVLTGLGGLVGVMATVSGLFFIAAPRIQAFRLEMQLLNATHPNAAAGLRGVGRAMRGLGIAGAVVGGIIALEQVFESIAGKSEAVEVGVGLATQQLLQLDSTNSRLVESMIQANTLLEETPDLWGKFSFGVGTSSTEIMNASATIEEGFKKADQSLANLVQTAGPEVAQRTFDLFAQSMQRGGFSMEEIRKKTPLFRDELAKLDNQEQITNETMTETDRRLEDLAIRFGLTGEDAKKAAEDMLDAWSEAGAEFVDLLGAYETALEKKEEKERATAEASAEATKNVNDTWEDFVGDVSLTVDEYLEELRRMRKNQREWADNLIHLSFRVSDEMLNELVKLGPEGAELVALFRQMSNKELREAEDIWLGSTEAAVEGGIVNPILEAGPVLRRIAKSHGVATADQLASWIIKNGGTVKDAAKALGIDIDDALRDGEDRTIPTKVTGDAQVARKMRKIKNDVESLPRSRKIKITAEGRILGVTGVRGRVAQGGEIRGPGGPTDDQAGLFALSNREWVIRAEAAARQGRERMKALNEGRARILMPGEGGRFASVPSGARTRVPIEFDSSDLNAADFRDLGSRTFSRMAKLWASRAGTSDGAPGPGTNTGKVLPPGRYRIGRGPASHGYNARDLPAPIGTPIYAAAAGIVTAARRMFTSYGIHARIAHAGGWRTLYAHMSKMFVRTGQQVSRGQMIGRVGSTGNSTGPHLHLEPDLRRLYDRGGKLPHGAGAINMSGGTEYVLSPEQSRMFDRMIVAMESSNRRPAQPQPSQVDVHVQAWTDRFSWRQVKDELAMHGVA